MADYFVQFSCMFDVGTAENAVRAIEIQRQQALALFDDEGSDPGFDVQHDPQTGPGALWISSDEYGEPEHVIAFVLACAEAFDLTGRWGFVWALCRYRHNAHYAGIRIMPHGQSGDAIGLATAMRLFGIIRALRGRQAADRQADIARLALPAMRSAAVPCL